ncbi:MAG: MBL fold metallo-hydrolase [Gammaproteobacteria bacterium]|nr:MBL fold metallo-hydrolase [Gammaproteobacteria bacterium]NNF60542.1 MBL fold metallo-hydrolase [Gammaproteobacteria bacterium]NNM20276.1 MBL fold metallo-hydrolase [Gammaproteobacteria bacterium]
MPHQVKSFFDPETSTWTHVLSCSASSRTAIIDPVLDYDPDSGRTRTIAADALISYVRDNNLVVDWIFETHAHADHLSAAQHVRASVGGQIAIGTGIRQVQQTFCRFFNLGERFPTDGRQFDRLLEEGEKIRLGELCLEVMATPGHTNDSISLLLPGAAFIGDTLFSPGYGTARCDFPGGDAAGLYQSIRKLLSLPPETVLYLCHDYPPAGEEPRAAVSVAEQKRDNIHVNDGVTEAEFVAMRSERDAGLPVPRLLLPSVQFNISAGQKPPAESNGVSYLKIPLDQL